MPQMDCQIGHLAQKWIDESGLPETTAPVVRVI